MDGARIRGSGGAPLVATREYLFERGTTPTGQAKLAIPWLQRGSWDDHGAVERPEQELFVARLLASIGAAARTGEPGEWIFADAAELERAWAALAGSLRPPAPAAPTGQARRSVSRDEARSVAGDLLHRYLDLVQAVRGAAAGPRRCIDSRIDHGGWETTRLEVWQCGDIEVRLDAAAIESGHGIHGETSSLSTTTPDGEGRDASVHASIDMRSGGEVHVTVRGVLDAQALADRFIAGLA